MATREKDIDGNKGQAGWPGMFWCGSAGGPEGMAGCCGGTWPTGDGRSMMGRCMAMCRWFPLVPLIFGIALLLLGYYLDASTTRVLWMLAAGFLALMGVLGLIVGGRLKTMCGGTR